MSVVGSLIFCLDCGNLLDAATSDKSITCGDCERSYNAKGMSEYNWINRSSSNINL